MYRVLKTREFEKWRKKGSELSDEHLKRAVEEMSNGLIDANLGKGLFKKRISLGKGKSKGARVLIATNREDRWIFMFGFNKNELANISITTKNSLQELSMDYLRATKSKIDNAIICGELIEVMYGKKN